jgi:hypothetical protein
VALPPLVPDCPPPPPPPLIQDCLSLHPLEKLSTRTRLPKSILKGDINNTSTAAENDHKQEEEECSSDTGLSSLSTSTEEGTYALTTLV